MADDNIRHVNCASDFRIVFAFSDGKLPDYPWRLGLKTPNTPSYNMYVASFDGTTYNNCSPLDDESIMVFVDHHRLVPGILHYYLQTDAPDSLFPDGEMNITIPGTVNIELWEGPSDGDTPPEVTVIVERLLKGDKGDPGDPGEAGQITFATASIDNTTGTPSVNIELGGTPEKRTIDFKFSGLKGEPGEPDESFVRYDEAQSPTTSEQNTALSNLGMKIYVTDSSFIGSTLSAEEIEEVAASKALLFTDTGDLFLFGSQDSNRISFCRPTNNYYIGHITINKHIGLVSGIGSYPYVDKDSLHFTAQNPALTSAQRSQAFANLGWKVHVISESAIGSSDAVSDDEKAARLSATALLVQETGVVYNFGVEEGGLRKFFGLFTNSLCNCLLVDVSSGAITTSTPWIHDQDAVSFTRNQSSVSDANKNRALSNIGLDFVRIDYSVIGTTLDDQLFNQIANAKGLVVNNLPEGLCVYIRARGTNPPVNFFTIRDATTVACLTLRNTDKTLTIGGSFAFSANCVYYIKQNLTNAQKQQARTNIGVKSADELLADDNFIAQLKTKLGIG